MYVSDISPLGLNLQGAIQLEEPLHVSSPLGTKVRIDQIYQDCELEISEILLTVDLQVMDISDFDVILGMDWLMHTELSLIVIIGGLLPTHGMISV